MSSTRVKKKLRISVSRHAGLFEELLEIRPILRGSFNQVHTRCGKGNCWCARSLEGHPHAQLSWSQNGKMTTRNVPAQHIDRIVELTDDYRRYRSLRRKLIDLQGEIHDLLDQYEKSLIAQSQRTFPFLPFPPEMSPSHGRGQRKESKQKKSKA